MNQEFEQHSGFEKNAKFYLDAAQSALVHNNPKLAMHLYRAAYEADVLQTGSPTPHVIEGLRKAWDLACEHNDRSMAESVFGDLTVHNTAEENEQAVLRLQSLALNQLEDMGISEMDIESIASAVSRELGEGAITDINDNAQSNTKTAEPSALQANVQGNSQAKMQANLLANMRADLLDSINEVLGQLDDAISKDSKIMPSRKADSDRMQEAKRLHTQADSGLSKLNNQLQEMRKRNEANAEASNLTYKKILGFDSTLNQMREFGFVPQGDADFERFAKRSAEIHGIASMSFGGSFVFYGESREDINLFAHATAGEMGMSIVHVMVDLDESGNGTIKLAGPFKRNLFGGGPDFMNLPTPCVVLIENLDYLQTMFDNEQKILKNNDVRMGSMMGGRSMQAEITSYLRSIRQKPDVYLVATTKSSASIKEGLRSLLGSLRHIEITNPNFNERMEILHTFADEHPSFAEIDLEAVSKYSDGLSRSDLISACAQSVESKYRESLRTRSFKKITLADVLVNIATYLDKSTDLHHQIEEEVVAQLYRDIDRELL